MIATFKYTEREHNTQKRRCIVFIYIIEYYGKK
nr:MAG TPA: hypothetical protein [Caudoviricetes sp.]